MILFIFFRAAALCFRVPPLTSRTSANEAKPFAAVPLWLMTFIVVTTNTYGQNTSSEIYNYGRWVVDSFASESYYGRGYLNDGDKKAASFITKEFKKFGLKAFTTSYEQKFSISVNTFPKNVFLSIDNFNLISGKDWVPNESCPDIKGEYELAWLDSNTVTDNNLFKEFARRDFKNVFIVIDAKGIKSEDGKNILKNITKNPYGAKGFIYVRDKITWSVGTEVNSFPTVDVVRGNISKINKKIKLNIDSKFVSNYQTQNLIGYIEGHIKDSFMVISAHYDHLGMIGKNTIFTGANDNASGTAMLLSLAQYFSKNKPKYSVAFMCFGAEEAGILGSQYYTEHPLFPLKQIKFLFNVDIMGTGEDGITVVNSTEFKNQFELLEKINSELSLISTIKKRGPAANSDHYFFYEKKVPCFFAYTMGGVKFYHDIDDRPETLPLNEFNDLHILFREFIIRQ